MNQEIKGRASQIPALASVTLETLTPLHIGSGLSLVSDGDEWSECQQIVQIARRRQDGLPYVPGSTIKGMLRSLYEFACELAKTRVDSNVIFGSTKEASKVFFNDLLPDAEVVADSKMVRCVCPDDEHCKKGIHKHGFKTELIPGRTTLCGQVSFLDTCLSEVLERIYRQREGIADQLKARGKSVEAKLANAGYVTEIRKSADELFRRQGEHEYLFTWKLGKYTKQYAKVLTKERSSRSSSRNERRKREFYGFPYAFMTVSETRELLGWIRLTINLAPPNAAFRLNEW